MDMLKERIRKATIAPPIRLSDSEKIDEYIDRPVDQPAPLYFVPVECAP